MSGDVETWESVIWRRLSDKRMELRRLASNRKTCTMACSARSQLGGPKKSLVSQRSRLTKQCPCQKRTKEDRLQAQSTRGRSGRIAVFVWIVHSPRSVDVAPSHKAVSDLEEAVEFLMRQLGQLLGYGSNSVRLLLQGTPIQLQARATARARQTNRRPLNCGWSSIERSG